MSGERPYLHAATLSLLRARSRKPSRPVRFLMIKRSYWQLLAIAILAAAPAVAQTPDYPDRDKPDIDLYALMSGKCPTLKVAGRHPVRYGVEFRSSDDSSGSGRPLRSRRIPSVTARAMASQVTLERIPRSAEVSASPAPARGAV